MDSGGAEEGGHTTDTPAATGPSGGNATKSRTHTHALALSLRGVCGRIHTSRVRLAAALHPCARRLKTGSLCKVWSKAVSRGWNRGSSPWRVTQNSGIPRICLPEAVEKEDEAWGTVLGRGLQGLCPSQVTARLAGSKHSARGGTSDRSLHGFLWPPASLSIPRSWS